MNEIFQQFSLQGQVAVVTGAGKGIGRACAITLAKVGADVALFARTEADLLAVKADIEALGRRAIMVPGDVNNPEDLDQLIARTVAELGKLTVLINNVGGGGPNDPRKVSGKAVGDMLAFNVVPAYTLIQKAAEAMAAAGGGAVVNISSTAARYSQKYFSAYGAAKAALNQMTRCLAQDFGPKVRINAIEPGTIMTDALAPFLTPERKERMERTTPMARLGQPEDIAAAALFLVSPASSWVTGKVLGVDGGVEAPNF
ncbi:glucose 1-dehydrogenase [Comamonas sp. Y33R10-2]|uniref:glucose 1-dehydrogenase n=1 Tax=Comamonas sp. Y33R10-2 TaxID=2853257 RepID=UPI001C5CB31A|nr:glucose 1-dehydrogenase [Comamonas sp. Y33R10-2]QXZ08494.1 glucose 1-dehydrogenase [Comamonas sp. Y33R10-2]